MKKQGIRNKSVMGIKLHEDYNVRKSNHYKVMILFHMLFAFVMTRCWIKQSYQFKFHLRRKLIECIKFPKELLP